VEGSGQEVDRTQRIHGMGTSLAYSRSGEPPAFQTVAFKYYWSSHPGRQKVKKDNQKEKQFINLRDINPKQAKTQQCLPQNHRLERAARGRANITDK